MHNNLTHIRAKGQEAVRRRLMNCLPDIYDCNIPQSTYYTHIYVCMMYVHTYVWQPRRTTFGRASSVSQPNEPKVESQLSGHGKKLYCRTSFALIKRILRFLTFIELSNLGVFIYIKLKLVTIWLVNNESLKIANSNLNLTVKLAKLKSSKSLC